MHHTEDAAKAKRGDSVSQGRLLEMLSQSVHMCGPKPSTTMTTGTAPRSDAGGNPWDSPDMPGREVEQ